jgi:hypothetical protein
VRGGRGRGRSGWEGRGWGQGGEMKQALYAHMNNQKINKKIKKKKKASKRTNFPLKKKKIRYKHMSNYHNESLVYN